MSLMLHLDGSLNSKTVQCVKPFSFPLFLSQCMHRADTF